MCDIIRQCTVRDDVCASTALQISLYVSPAARFAVFKRTDATDDAGLPNLMDNQQLYQLNDAAYIPNRDAWLSDAYPSFTATNESINARI